MSAKLMKQYLLKAELMKPHFIIAEIINYYLITAKLIKSYLITFKLKKHGPVFAIGLPWCVSGSLEADYPKGLPWCVSCRSTRTTMSLHSPLYPMSGRNPCFIITAQNRPLMFFSSAGCHVTLIP